MDATDAAILGVVEGVTEFLPVSSTGHLIVAQRALGIPEGAAADSYAIAIQSGAILAVLVLYWRRLLQIAAGLVGRDGAGLRLGVAVLVAFLPAAALGFLFHDAIERALFGIWPVVGAWTVGALAILALGNRLRPEGGRAVLEIDARTALLIGLFQCLSLWPGTSRSLATIVGGILLGLSVPAAIEFSFLLGFLTLGAATAYSATKHGGLMLDSYGVAPIAVGLVAAFVSAVIAVRFLVSWLTNHGMALFAGWRLAMAALVSGLALSGWFA
jgi:undecaprenyl-diphosphatase